MKRRFPSPGKKIRIAISTLLSVLVVLTGGFFWYVSDYYRAEAG